MQKIERASKLTVDKGTATRQRHSNERGYGSLQQDYSISRPFAYRSWATRSRTIRASLPTNGRKQNKITGKDDNWCHGGGASCEAERDNKSTINSAVAQAPGVAYLSYTFISTVKGTGECISSRR